MSKLLPSLPTCDPSARHFPAAWKESYFRRNFDESRDGYVCPDCNQAFAGPGGFQQLEADHIVPYAEGGLTEWDNLTLRCKPCNVMKSNKT